MKTCIALLLFAAIGCGAQETSGITSKVSEIDRDKDGKIDVRQEMFYRGKEKVMMLLSRRNQQGVMAVVMRGYLVEGKLVMAEADDDGDGFFESMTLFGPGGDGFEMFTRGPDGTARPVSHRQLESVRRQKAAADASLRRLFDGSDRTPEEVEELMEKNRRTIESIKAEANDADH